MSDPATPIITPQAAGDVTGNNLAQVIAQAVAAGVTTSMNEITAKLNSLSESINKIADATTSNTQTNVVGADDPYSEQRVWRTWHDVIMFYTTKAMGQQLDHSASLPPMAPRSPTGPGTSAG